jgi:ribonucleoside-diphosphate reductase alpha chain
MNVLKRDGRKEPIMFDKITARVKKLCYGLNELVDPVRISMRVIEACWRFSRQSKPPPHSLK